jgi:hypothetical protein
MMCSREGRNFQQKGLELTFFFILRKIQLIINSMEKYGICKVAGSNPTSISAAFWLRWFSGVTLNGKFLWDLFLFKRLIDWKGNFKKNYYKNLEYLRVIFIHYFVHFGRQFEAF